LMKITKQERVYIRPLGSLSLRALQKQKFDLDFSDLLKVNLLSH
jgi:hypothetical protein